MQAIEIELSSIQTDFADPASIKFILLRLSIAKLGEL